MVQTLAQVATRWSRAAAVGALLLAAGCCAHGRAGGKLEAPPTGGPHTFKVLLDDAGCPVDAEMEPAKRNCANQNRRCVKVDRSAKASVTFVAEGKGDFVLYFDPFLKAPLASEGGRITLDIPADVPTKSYSFNIAGRDRAKCKVIDPEIIVW